MTGAKTMNDASSAAGEKIIDTTRDHLAEHGTLKPVGNKIPVMTAESIAESASIARSLSDAEPPKPPMPLRHNALDGFGNGACLDLRVRFAMELLKSPIGE